MTKGFLNNDKEVLTQIYKHIEQKQKRWDHVHYYTHNPLYVTIFVIIVLVLLCISHCYNPLYEFPIIGGVFFWGSIRDKSEGSETQYSEILYQLKRKIESLE